MNKLNNLTDRERDVLGKIAEGKNNQQIAQELVISSKTVERHNIHIFEKLGVSNRTEAAVCWLREGPKNTRDSSLPGGER